MGLNVGELFVNLGVKGSDKTLGAITGVKKGLSETASMALETKAALLAVFYVLERLTAATGKVGSELKNFQTLTGISAQTLQRYQYAAQQAGVSNDEVTSSFKGLQNAMTAVIRGEGAPAGLKLLSLALEKVGDSIDLSKIRDTAYVMEKLNKIAQGGMAADIKKWALGTTGLTEGMITAMERGKFNPDILKSAPAYTENQINGLDKANVAWMNLGTHIEMAFGKFNAAHGAKMVGDLTGVTDQVLKFAEALEKIGEKVHFLERVGDIFAGLGNTLRLLIELMDKFNGVDHEKGLLAGGLPGFDESPVGKIVAGKTSMMKDFFGSFMDLQMKGPLSRQNMNFSPSHPNFYAIPDTSKFPAVVLPPKINVKIEQHPGAKDKLKVKESHSSTDMKQVNYAFRQQSTLLQGA